MVSLQFTLTKEDYVNFYTYVMWDAGDLRKKRAKNILKQLVFVLIFIAVYYFAGGFLYLNRFTILIILLMFATSFLPLIGGRSSAGRQAEEIAEDPDNASVFAPTTLLATDAGLQINSDLTETRYSWKAVIRKTETDAYYFLFVNAVQAVIIPKRVFGSNNEKAEFQKMLSRNISLDAEIKDEIINAGE